MTVAQIISNAYREAALYVPLCCGPLDRGEYAAVVEYYVLESIRDPLAEIAVAVERAAERAIDSATRARDRSPRSGRPRTAERAMNARKPFLFLAPPPPVRPWLCLCWKHDHPTARERHVCPANRKTIIGRVLGWSALKLAGGNYLPPRGVLRAVLGRMRTRVRWWLR